MFGPVLFVITKYNTMVSIFLSVFIGIINYEQHFFLLYLIQFYTDFLSQIRHLQIEVGGGGGADDFDTWSHLEQKTKKIIVQYTRGFVPN